MALSRPPSSVVPRSFPVRVPPCCASLRLQGCALQAQRRATPTLPRPLPRRLRRLPPPLRSLRSLPVGGLPPCCPPPLAVALLHPHFVLRLSCAALAASRCLRFASASACFSPRRCRGQALRSFAGASASLRRATPTHSPRPLPRRRCLRFASASPPAPSPSVATLPARRGLTASFLLVGGITHAPLPLGAPLRCFS